MQMREQEDARRRFTGRGMSRTLLLILITVVTTLGLVLFLSASEAKEGLFVAPGIQPTAEATPDEIMAASLAEKAAMEDRYFAALNQIQGAPPPRNRPPPGDLQPIDDPAFLTGILEGVSGPFSSQDVVVVNLWQEEVEGGFVQVFAGAYSLVPEQGVLVVLSTSGDRLDTSEERYPTNGLFGALRIDRAEGEILFLTAEDGTELTFNLQTREYSPPG